MSKTFLFILFSALSLLVFSIFPKSASANTAYEITAAIPNSGISGRGSTFFTKDLTINYQSGKVLLSSRPDGTGDTRVDDGVSINVTHSDGTTATATFEYHGNCFAITPKPPQDVTNLFKSGANKVTVRLYDVCGTYISSSAIYLYLVISSDPGANPLTPTPFLELPWDYQGQGLSFNDAALSINSFFDHEYPLLSSSLSESNNTPKIIDYLGPPRVDESYSSHDGYDYGRRAGAIMGDSVLATDAGVATYVNSCTPCGNAIFIDHGNGYQTRYYHLQRNSLITNVPGQRVNVNSGQQIGRIGITGNVRPPGGAGAHIHFMVIQDKNNDGNFEDNIPDGVTDPFGWQSTQPDPWPAFVFNYGGQSHTGNTSFYLWKKKIDNLSETLTANGGVFNVGRYTVDIPPNTTDQNLNLQINSSPTQSSNNLVSIGSTIVATVKDALGNLINQFQSFFTISVDFSQFDLSAYKPETISFYSSEDGINWTKETTSVDLANSIATTIVDHMTYFALMAERVDTVAPQTIANLSGDQGELNWFRSDVSVTLNATDNEGGLGVDYTLYKLEGGDWEIYTTPLEFTNEGHHKVEFYSIDKDDNIEEIRSVEFDIDKIPPEGEIFIDLDKLDLVVEGVDQNQTDVERLNHETTLQKGNVIYIIEDLAGNTLRLDVRDRDGEKIDKLGLYSIQYNSDSPIKQLDNELVVEYKGKKDKLGVGEQRFEIKKDTKMKIKYDYAKDQSTIITNESGHEKVKEIKDGLTLLQLYTEKGTLKYSY